MTGLSTKELWTVKGRPMSNGHTLENSLYGFSGNPLIPYEEGSTPPKYCIFVVRGTDGTESGWLFQNDEIGGEYISEKLHDFIIGDRKTTFYRCQNPHIARARIAQTREYLDLHDLLYCYKYGVDTAQVKELQVRLIDTASGVSLGDTQIFDLMWANLESNQKPASLFISDVHKEAVQGVVLYGSRTMAVYYPERRGEDFLSRYFTTEYDPRLYVVLCKSTSIGSWVVKNGALKIVLSDGSGKWTEISFGEIVGTFYRGLIDKEDPIGSILRNHTTLMGDGSTSRMIVYDHLTHNKENNFSWAIGEVSERLNKQLRGRDRIRPPYYLLTTYDVGIRKYRVKLGALGFGWER